MNDEGDSKANLLPVGNPRQRWLHIFTLCSFAFVQPLLIALQGQTVYLIDQQIGMAEITVMLTVLMLVPPAVLIVIDTIAQWSPFRFGRNAAFVILFALVLLSLVRKFVSTSWLLYSGLAFILLGAIVIPATILGVYLYCRANWFRMWLTIASMGIVIFPAAFVWQFRQIVHQDENRKVVEIGNPVPVVFVIFDEFSGTTLMNDQMQIDVVRFPQFAKLADRSTWYRNATTVHPRTEFAVPTILSGKFPVVDRPAVEAEYPGNLLQLVEQSRAFDLAVFEPLSRLCPRVGNYERAIERRTTHKVYDLIRTLVIVYPRLVLTSDVPVDLPRLPLDWLGMNVGTNKRLDKPFEKTDGVFNHAGGQNRRQQLDQFLRSLKKTEKPRFAFLHTIFPHCPWVFFPTGEQYLAESVGSTMLHGGLGELGEDWTDDAAVVLRNQHRYRLQVGYADQFIGRLLDRLDEVGMMDECLLIVTADHGVSFRPKHSRRVPDADIVPDILSVPLFIKWPGQKNGKVDDRNVESVDLLPTVAEVLKIDLPEPVDGLSVSQENCRPRKSFYFNSAMTVLEPNLPQRESAVRQQFARFGDRPLEDLPDGAAAHPEWHGRTVSSFEIDRQTSPVIFNDVLTPEADNDDLTGATLVRCFVTGSLSANEPTQKPVELVVAVDGIVRDTGRTFLFQNRIHTFEFLLPLSTANVSPGKIELYKVEQSGSVPRLKRLVP